MTDLQNTPPDSGDFTHYEARLVENGVNVSGKVYQRHLETAQAKAREKATQEGKDPNKRAAESVRSIRNVSVIALYTTIMAFIGIVTVLLLVNEVLATTAGLAPFLGGWKAALFGLTLVLAYPVLLFIDSFSDNERSARERISLRHVYQRARYWLGFPPTTWQVETYTPQDMSVQRILSVYVAAIVGFSMLGRLARILDSDEIRDLPAAQGFAYLVAHIPLFDLLGTVLIAVATWALLWGTHYMVSFISADFARITGGANVGTQTPDAIYHSEMKRWYERQLTMAQYKAQSNSDA